MISYFILFCIKQIKIAVKVHQILKLTLVLCNGDYLMGHLWAFNTFLSRKKSFIVKVEGKRLAVISKIYRLFHPPIAYRCRTNLSFSPHRRNLRSTMLCSILLTFFVQAVNTILLKMLESWLPKFFWTHIPAFYVLQAVAYLRRGK